MNRARLSEWLANIRGELAQASQTYQEQGKPSPGLNLKDVVLELEVTTEGSKTAELGWELWVVSGKVTGEDKQLHTQKLKLTFEPVIDVILGE